MDEKGMNEERTLKICGQFSSTGLILLPLIILNISGDYFQEFEQKYRTSANRYVLVLVYIK